MASEDRFDQWKGQVVRLRSVEPADWEQFRELDREDSEGQRRGFFVPKPLSNASRETWARGQAERRPADDNDDWGWAIEVVESGLLAGHMNVHESNRRHGYFEYGITLGPDFRGKGFAADAVKLVCRHYFGELRYHRISGIVYAFNSHSQRFHERFGFVREGQLREYHFSAGRHHDVFWYGMTASEFWARYPEMRAGPWQG